MAAMMMTMMSSAKTQDWGGRVIDEKGEPMPYVNVVLLSLPDSAFVQGALTDMDGVFKIVTDVNARSSESHPSSLDDGRVVTSEDEVSEGLFKVTSVGYQTLYISLTPNPSPTGEGSEYTQGGNAAGEVTTPLAHWRGAGVRLSPPPPSPLPSERCN